MRTDRSYRKALRHEVAVSQMHEHTGTQFDPAVVRALLAAVAQPSPAAADSVALRPPPADPAAAPVSSAGAASLVTSP